MEVSNTQTFIVMFSPNRRLSPRQWYTAYSTPAMRGVSWSFWEEIAQNLAGTHRAF